MAAFLTIIGYSIYDTIIIFDRVRENLPIMRRSSIKTIINTSLWETVRRSLATTIITLLPVGALYLFGGEVLQDFSFAILIGIGISAFSTIFIAAPFLAVLLERAPSTRAAGRSTTSRSTRPVEGSPSRFPSARSTGETSVGTERSPHPFRLPPRRRAPTRRSASADVSAAELALMAEPDSNGAVRDLLERIALATVGAAALTAERADALADELADRGMVRRDEARALIDDVSARWRGDATRFGEMAGSTLDRLFRELGLVTKDDMEELELRLAQLEHRLRLLEDPPKGFRAARATLIPWLRRLREAWGASPRSPRSPSGTGSATSSAATS